MEMMPANWEIQDQACVRVDLGVLQQGETLSFDISTDSGWIYCYSHQTLSLSIRMSSHTEVTQYGRATLFSRHSMALETGTGQFHPTGMQHGGT